MGSVVPRTRRMEAEGWEGWRGEPSVGTEACLVDRLVSLPENDFRLPAEPASRPAALPPHVALPHALQESNGSHML